MENSFKTLANIIKSNPKEFEKTSKSTGTDYKLIPFIIGNLDNSPGFFISFKYRTKSKKLASYVIEDFPKGWSLAGIMPNMVSLSNEKCNFVFNLSNPLEVRVFDRTSNK